MGGSVQCGSSTGPGDRVRGGLHRRALDPGGVGAGVEREPQGGPGPGGRRRRAVAEAELVVGAAGRDVAALHGLGGLVGPDDPDAFGRVGGLRARLDRDLRWSSMAPPGGTRRRRRASVPVEPADRAACRLAGCRAVASPRHRGQSSSSSCSLAPSAASIVGFCGLGELVELLLGPGQLVLGEVAVLLERLELLAAGPAQVADGDPARPRPCP